MSSTIQVRVDDDLKIKSDNLFRELGTDTTTAIRMFLTQAVANNGFPFEIKKVAANPYIAISEKEVLDRLAKSRDQSKNGEYSEAGDFVADIPLYEKLDFYKEELLQMKNLGLNPSLKDDRFEFMKIFNLENRQKRIPHYWNQDESGLIIDLSGYSQFVKKGFAKDLNQSRYEIKDLEKTNFKSLSLK